MDCVCCTGPTAGEQLCDYCTVDGPDDAVKGCDVRAWHCVCDLACDGTACRVLVGEYRTECDQGSVPRTVILAYRECVASGDLTRWDEVVYHYSDIDEELIDRRESIVREVSGNEMRAAVSAALRSGYTQVYPAGGKS